MTEAYKILFVEDKVNDVKAMQSELKKAGIDFVAEQVNNKNGFLSAITTFEPDIILAEQELGDIDALDAFKFTLSAKNRPAFIIVAKKLRQELALQSCKEGVDDHISKSNYDKLPVLVLKALEKRKQEIQRNEIAIDILKRNKELEAFAYMVSHNLGSSVANIKGLFDIWDPDKRTQHEQKYIYAGLKFSIQKLDEVIKDIQTLLIIKNNLKEGKQLVKFENLVKDIKISHYTVIKKAGVRFRTNFKEVDGLLTNKSYLNSIFYNLISNSIKYKREDVPPLITITSKLDKDHVELIFKDNGIGIDLNAHGENLFGLYKRFNDTQEGKGMGLFLVKSQVEALSGTINVRSEINKGCEFYLRFPVK
jgi:signal transduction histidine kinase